MAFEISDSDIVERVLDGEADAYALLVQRYQDKVYSRPTEWQEIMPMHQIWLRMHW